MAVKIWNQTEAPARAFRHGNHVIVTRNVTEKTDDEGNVSYDFEAYTMPAAPVSDPDQYCLDNYSAIREAVILAHWPQDAQNEAVTENLMGRTEKATELTAFIVALKEEFPKP